SSLANSEERSDIERRNSVTIALTELPRSAARIRADRYTSSGTEIVMFFTYSQYHRTTDSRGTSASWVSQLGKGIAGGRSLVPDKVSVGVLDGLLVALATEHHDVTGTSRGQGGPDGLTAVGDEQQVLAPAAARRAGSDRLE